MDPTKPNFCAYCGSPLQPAELRVLMISIGYLLANKICAFLYVYGVPGAERIRVDLRQKNEINNPRQGFRRA